MKQFVIRVFAIVAVAVSALTANFTVQAANEFEGQTVKVGVVGSSMKEIFEYVGEKAAKEGIKVEVVELNDYNIPNEALLAKEIDINAFQHQVFLDDWNKAHNADIQNIGYTFAVPVRLYSEKYKSLDELPEGAKIAISADPVGSAYAIKILANDAKLFTLREGVGDSPTQADIVENPRKIELVELDAAQIPAAMLDVDAGIIQDSFLKGTHFKPADAIYIYGNKPETLNLKRVNIIAARKEDVDNPLYKHIVELFQQEDTAKKIEAVTEGSIIPAWDLVKEAQKLKANDASSESSSESSSSN